MRKTLWSLIIVLLAGPLWAETVTGVLDGLNPTRNELVVNGVAYEADFEQVPVFRGEERISYQDLRPGDELRLVLNDESGASVERTVEEIVLVQGD